MQQKRNTRKWRMTALAVLVAGGPSSLWSQQVINDDLQVNGDTTVGTPTVSQDLTVNGGLYVTGGSSVASSLVIGDGSNLNDVLPAYTNMLIVGRSNVNQNNRSSIIVGEGNTLGGSFYPGRFILGNNNALGAGYGGALGRGNYAIDGIALGEGLTISGSPKYQVGVGRYNDDTSLTDKVFIVGIGDDDTSRADGLVVKQDGSVIIPGTLNVGGGNVVTQSNAAATLAGQFVPNSSGATGTRAIAIGWNATASGYESVAIGPSANASSGGHAFAIGKYVTSSGGEGSMAMGYESQSTAYVSTAMGYQTLASGMVSTAMGDNTIAKAYASLAMGAYNEGRFSGAGHNSWIGDDLNSVLEVGIGTQSGGRKNALTVLQDGSVEVGRATATDDSVPLKVSSNGSVTLSGNVILSEAQGDISMGDYGNPAP